MKRLLCLLLVLCLTGCAKAPEQKQYTATFLTLFDTVTSIVGRAESQEAHMAAAQAIHDELLVYHQLFDIYNDYEGLNNLKTVNDNAGVAPVVVDRAIIDLLLDCKEYYDLTTMIRDYDTDFIEGCLIEAWDTVCGLALTKLHNLPF